MKHFYTTVLIFSFGFLFPVFSFAEQITLDLQTATNTNGTPIAYSSSPIAEAYYDLTDVWSDTYNDADSCQVIVCNDGIFRLSHIPSRMAYGGMSWEGFTVSIVSQDTANVFGCVANGGLSGIGTPYAIGYYSDWVSSAQGYSSNIIDFNGEYYPEYIYVCQNSNTFEGITNGVFNSNPFTNEDTLALIIQALDKTMQPTASLTYYLAIDGNKNTSWIKVPLTALGKTTRIGFAMTTTDIGTWGANTPLYFAIDRLTINTELPTSLPSNPIYSNAKYHKLLRNGQLVIEYNEQYYDFLGNQVE